MTVQDTNLGYVARADVQERHLFHPVVDFLCLGGASLIVLPLMVLAVPGYVPVPLIATIALLLANAINHPHFAHSYQIFYDNFSHKAFGRDADRALALRYVAAGIVVPILLAAYFAFAYVSADKRIIGYGANIMIFFIGWHYVKQGYGMLIVDTVLKRQYLGAGEKKILLFNAYACWPASWMLLNATVAKEVQFGLAYYSFAMPPILITLACLVAGATSVAALIVIARRRLQSGRLPVNGLVAYVASIYIWLFLLPLHPALWLLIPAFHSLQYLIVVWRFQLNLERDRPNRVGAGRRLARFVAVGTAWGFVGFWALPFALGFALPDNHIGPTNASVFLFMTWIFINVHHYFLDNVMWRRENPDAGKYLFS